MNRKQLINSAAALILACAASSTANAASVSGTATATVIEPLTVTENVAMQFGTIAGGPSAGTVVLTTAGARTTTGDAQIISAGAGAAADFDLTGEASQAITVTVVTAGAQLDDAGGGAIMALSTFTNTGLPTSIGGAGTATFQVGATLAVGASQGAGAYSTALGSGATYSVTVNYD